MDREQRPPEEPHPDEPRADGEPIPTPADRGDPLPSEEETAETPDDELVDRTQNLMRDGISDRSPKR
jgi:hypothetical protein